MGLGGAEKLPVLGAHAQGIPLLAVEDLTVAFEMYNPEAPYFAARRVRSEVLHGLSLSLRAGELLAVVGASGAGKSLLADCLMGLYEPNAEVTGRIFFDGAQQGPASLAGLRGHGVSLVPQSVAHLDPLMRVGEQVRGAACGATRAERRRDAERRAARQRELFERYALGREVERLYPHQLSGGMARRVLLMCALMDNPRLIIADEPTPGLDLELATRALGDLRRFANDGGGVLLITHDLELALRVADHVAVFCDGTVVEQADAASFAAPELLRHPYSRALWHALPEHGFAVAGEREEAGALIGLGVRADVAGSRARVDAAAGTGARPVATGEGPLVRSDAAEDSLARPAAAPEGSLARPAAVPEGPLARPIAPEDPPVRSDAEVRP